MRRLDGKPPNCKFQDLTGMRFGSLVALRTLPREIGEHRRWVCLCDCGNEHIVCGYNLLNGQTLSCGSGCRKPVYTEESMQRKKDAMIRPGSAFRKCLLNYKSAARKRGLTWELTEDQFRDITSSPCYYTGFLPSNNAVADSGETYIYNGIDRLDNDKGYTTDNCVPCCFEANKMKLDSNKERFVELCKIIAERFK